jgi:hypothetical protein
MAEARNERLQRALAEGPATLTASEQLRLLGDLDALDTLHRAVTSRRVHPDWTSSRARGRATIHYLTPHGRGKPGTLATLVRQS